MRFGFTTPSTVFSTLSGEPCSSSHFVVVVVVVVVSGAFADAVSAVIARSVRRSVATSGVLSKTSRRGKSWTIGHVK
jgi:hypothetical protein